MESNYLQMTGPTCTCYDQHDGFKLIKKKDVLADLIMSQFEDNGNDLKSRINNKTILSILKHSFRVTLNFF